MSNLIDELSDFFTRSKPTSFIDTILIRNIQISLLKYSKIAPEAILQDKDQQLVNDLCSLQIEITHLEKGKLSTQHVALLNKIHSDLDRLLEPNFRFSDCQGFIDLLDRLSEAIHRQARRSRKIKRTKTIFALLISIGPLIGYGLHIFLVSYYNGAVIEKVDFIFPERLYSLDEDEYRLKSEIITENLSAFRDFYFAETMQEEHPVNPLVLVHNNEVTELLANKLDAGSEIIIFMGEKNIYPDLDAKNKNIVLFRVFVRSMHESNIVHRLRVEANRIGDNDFPWQRLDVSTEISFYHSIIDDSFDHLISTKFSTDHTPITDLVMKAVLHTTDDRNNANATDTIGHLITEQNWAPDFNKSILHRWSTDWLLLHIDAADIENIELNPAFEKSIEALEVELDTTSGVGSYFMENPYRYVRCENGDMVILSSLDKIQQLFLIDSIEDFSVSYEYLLLNGEIHKKQLSFPTDGRLLVSTTLVSNHSNQLLECVGERIMDLTGTPVFHPQMHVLADALTAEMLSRFLMDQPLTLPPEIVAEETFWFNFSGKTDTLSYSTNDIVIMQKDNYVLFNIIATDFPGGSYQFKFYFNEEEVGKVNVNLVWPQSLHYTPGGEAYFRSIE